jgi:glycosyltransferase involved in cell wall biosynthesis
MKILFFIESLRFGGKERRLLELVRYLKFNKNFEVVIVLTENTIDYKYIYDWDVPIFIIKRKGLKKDPRIFLKLFKICKKIKPNIIHTWGVMNTVYAVPTKLIFGIPLVTSMISNANFNIKPWSLEMFFFKISCFFSDSILSNSKAGLLAYRIRGRKGRVIYNGININRFNKDFHKEKTRKKLNISTPYSIVMVASVSKNKHYDLFIDVAKMIGEQRKDITFVSIGGGSESARIQNRIVSERLNNLLMLGKRSDVEEIVYSSDIGVLFTYCEGFPNSVMEYMALKKPAIVSNEGGVNELIVDNSVGYLISNNNISDICNKITHLIDNSEKRNRFGSNGYKEIKEKYTIEIMSLKFIEIYKSLINKNKF